MYTSTITSATNSADNRTNILAVIANVKTRDIAACITFEVVTTLTATNKSPNIKK
jgi:hypothetical protein